MEQILDLSFARDYDIYVNNIDFVDVTITCIYFIDINEFSFDFARYSGATMIITDDDETIVETFSTLDGSIVLEDNGIFKIIKNYDEMDEHISGKFNYNMNLSSNESPNIDFLSGKIIF